MKNLLIPLTAFCPQCVPRFSDSFIDTMNTFEESEPELELSFNNIRNCHNYSGHSSEVRGHVSFSNNLNTLPNITQLRKANLGRCIIAYLIINSLRNKFNCFKDLILPDNLDICGLGETKIDQSFPDAQFNINGFRMFCKDRTCYGGGILTYIHSDLPCRRLPHLETKEVESLVIEIRIASSTWCLIVGYKPPKLQDDIFSREMNDLCNNITGG